MKGNMNMKTETNAEARASIFTADQETALRQLKAWKPFAIVWGAVSENGEFVTGADYTRHRLNSYLRKPGWIVATIG